MDMLLLHVLVLEMDPENSLKNEKVMDWSLSIRIQKTNAAKRLVNHVLSSKVLRLVLKCRLKGICQFETFITYSLDT